MAEVCSNGVAIPGLLSLKEITGAFKVVRVYYSPTGFRDDTTKGVVLYRNTATENPLAAKVIGPCPNLGEGGLCKLGGACTAPKFNTVER